MGTYTLDVTVSGTMLLVPLISTIVSRTVSARLVPITRKANPTTLLFRRKQSGSSRQETAKIRKKMNQDDFFMVWFEAVKIL
jgi:hypothetical protein